MVPPASDAAKTRFWASVGRVAASLRAARGGLATRPERLLQPPGALVESDQQRRATAQAASRHLLRL